MEIKYENLIFRRSFKGLGTDIVLTLVVDKEKNEEEAKKIFEKIKELYQKKENIFSRFDLASELSLLNDNLGKFQKASEDIINLCKLSLEYNESSYGFFDPRIIEVLEKIGYDRDFNNINHNQTTGLNNFKKNSTKLKQDLRIENGKVLFAKRMDFSGIAKGYITDKAALSLRENSWKNFLLDSGGDIFVSGLDQFGEKWKISVEGFPEERFNFEIRDLAVATSGITRRKWGKGGNRYHHLINPENPGKFSYVLKSVSVISENTTKADVLAKILFLMGIDEGIKYSEKYKIKSIFLDSRGNLFLSSEAKLINTK